MILLWLLVVAPQFPATAADTPPTVRYTIEAELLPAERTVRGHLTLVYTNLSPDVLPDLRFHAYLNAVLNTDSAFYTRRGHGGGRNDFGYLYVTEAAVDGRDVTPTYIQAQDAGPGDRTVFSLPLAAPLMPGASTTITFQFDAVLPFDWERVGYADDYFFVAQWFPKIGVWESVGTRGRQDAGWNCHANHADTEYYADFGDYDVTLTVPSTYVVGACGRGDAGEVQGDRTVYRFSQARVHDFAWVAWPHFRRLTRKYVPDPAVTLPTRPNPAGPDTPLPPPARPVELILLLSPEHAGQAARHFAAAEFALNWTAEHLMPYPYETLTLVDPPRKGRFSGGMEYPTLITLGTSYHNPSGNYDFESLLFHEFMHQYFYGLVATNETENSWMDEGMTDYVTDLVLDAYAGATDHYVRLGGARVLDRLVPFDTQFAFPILRDLQLKVPDPASGLLGVRPTAYPDQRRGTLRRFDDSDPLDMPAWRYRYYGISTYPKSAAMFAQLGEELGRDTMARVMARYVQTWAYGHPGPRDFQDVVEQVAERNMAWFFQPMLYGHDTLDFEALRPRSVPEDVRGFQFGPSGPEWISQDLEKTDRTFRHDVMVRRKGMRIYPVDVLVQFDDGTEIRERWSGEGGTHTFTYHTQSRVTRVVVDPDNKVLLDPDRRNNSFVVKADPSGADGIHVHFLLCVQHLLQSLVGGL